MGPCRRARRNPTTGSMRRFDLQHLPLRQENLQCRLDLHDRSSPKSKPVHRLFVTAAQAHMRLQTVRRHRPNRVHENPRAVRTSVALRLRPTRGQLSSSCSYRGRQSSTAPPAIRVSALDVPISALHRALPVLTGVKLANQLALRLALAAPCMGSSVDIPSTGGLRTGAPHP